MQLIYWTTDIQLFQSDFDRLFAKIWIFCDYKIAWGIPLLVKWPIIIIFENMDFNNIKPFSNLIKLHIPQHIGINF